MADAPWCTSVPPCVTVRPESYGEPSYGRLGVFLGCSKQPFIGATRMTKLFHYLVRVSGSATGCLALGVWVVASDALLAGLGFHFHHEASCMDECMLGQRIKGDLDGSPSIQRFMFTYSAHAT